MTECKSVFRQNFIHRHFDLDLAHTTNHTHKPTRFPNTILAKSSNKLSLPMALPPHTTCARGMAQSRQEEGEELRQQGQVSLHHYSVLQLTSHRSIVRRAPQPAVTHM